MEEYVMDDLARYNRARWNELAAANIEYTQPSLDLNADSARQMIDPWHIAGDVKGKKVLCLASGGGQQSAAFALLGADVTVLDLSDVQLERDRVAMSHYGLSARLIQGDMRNLSVFDEAAFDIVFQAYSLNFVPDSGQVFDQVK